MKVMYKMHDSRKEHALPHQEQLARRLGEAEGSPISIDDLPPCLPAQGRLLERHPPLLLPPFIAGKMVMRSFSQTTVLC